MQCFTDRSGRVWEFSLNGYTIERIRSIVKFPDGAPVDLWEIGDDDLEANPDQKNNHTLLQRLLAPRNRPVFLQVLHACLDCPFDEFAQAMDGDGIERATHAFLNETIELFPSAKRGTLRQILEQQRTLEAEIERRIRETNREAYNRALAALDGETPETPSGEWAASSALIPDPLRSDSSSTSPTPISAAGGTTQPRSLQ